MLHYPAGTVGLRAALSVCRDHPSVGVLVFSQYIETRSAAELFAGTSGGVGYLLKDRVALVSDFIDAIGRVAEGGTVLDPYVVRHLLSAGRRADALAALTPREREVLSLLAEMLSARETLVPVRSHGPS